MAIKTPILIFCRIKPSFSDSPEEIQEYKIKKGSDKDLLSIANHTITRVGVNHKPDFYNFQFVQVFDQRTDQKCIYDTVAKPIVESALKGYNGTIFAYGQTGSGKTYTVSGEKGNYGIIPRTLLDIFTSINAVKDEDFDVHMSYLEIYNEHSNDLLNKEEKKKISLREGGDKVFEWHNLCLCSVETFEAAMELLDLGDKNRIVADTPMNIVSSRSHTILTIYLTAKIQQSLDIKKAKLNLVDLAGSERVYKTNEQGIVLEEARHINLSLHYLQQVIMALSDSSRTHVPYRNCSLTSALRDSLGGNCMTAMVANIALDKANTEETISTCRFAQRVALVSNEVTVNLEHDLKEENNQLREQIYRLENKCASLETKILKLEKVGVSTKQAISIQEEKTPCHTQSLKNEQLQTDLIYLIEWIQDELKATQRNNNPENDDTGTSLSSFSVINTVDEDKFDEFAATIKENEDWSKAKEEEQKASEALSSKVDAISKVHLDILNWWKQDEKSLVREMLDGHTLNIIKSEPVASPAETTRREHYPDIERLLLTNSDLLKDIQLPERATTCTISAGIDVNP